MVYPHCYRTEHSETHTTNAVYGDYYAAMKSKKLKIQPELLKMFQYVDSRRAEFLNDLAEAVKFKSISGDPKYVEEVNRMIKFTESWLTKLDIKYECFDIGRFSLGEKEVALPHVILGSIGNDPRKKTVCAYIHLDVPDPKHQQWDTDPWTMTGKNNVYHGAGTACGKMPLMSWLHVVSGFKVTKLPLPVNLKFVIESMKHQGSTGLGKFVATRSQDFFANVDLVVECDSEWLGNKFPCVIYGTVGILNYQLTVEKTEKSQSSVEDDMVKICDTLMDDRGNILIKDFNNAVEQITPDEEKTYENIQDFDPDEIRDSLPEYKKSWDKVKLLMSFWRLPSMIIGETEHCICEKKDGKIVKRNFVIKIVPRQIVDTIDKLVMKHMQLRVKKLKIENKVTCKLIDSIRPWFENHYAPWYVAAKRAFLQVYKEDPNMIREDRGKQTATIFDNVLEKPVIILPLCPRSSNSGQANENINMRNYFEGTKLLAAYLFQYSYLAPDK